MPHTYQLSCESTVDMPFSYITDRGISVLFYSYTIDGVVYEDNMGRDAKALPWFYRQLREGKLPSTSQINESTYYDYFKSLSDKGDVLHLAFGSGMTPAVFHAKRAAEKLSEENPKRKIIVVDSTCSSSGYGLFVDTCADRWDSGETIEDLQKWAEMHCHNVHHQFFSTNLSQFKRSGRVSGVGATVATVLSVCPLMHLNYDGKIVAYGKVRGKKNAIRETAETLARHAKGGIMYSGKCFVCHSQCPKEADETAKLLKKTMPHIKEIRIFEIGTIIGAHAGSGTVAAFLWGDEREK